MISWQRQSSKNIGNTILLVGLGNVGKEYIGTRHNVGFAVVDSIADKYGLKWKKKLYHGEHAEMNQRGKKVILLRPTTYMNASGLAVSEACKRFSVTDENVLVAYDDIDLALGQLRIRAKGGAGTHNGMKSVIQEIHTQDFPRFRLGIGAPPHKEALVGYVLGKFGSEEREKINDAVKLSIEAFALFLEKGIEQTMNRYNSSETI